MLVIHYWIKSTFVRINMFSIRFHDQLMRMMLIIRYGNIVSTREHYIISQVWNDCEQWRGIYHRIILIIIQIDVSLLDNFPDLRTEMDWKGYQRSLKGALGAWLFRTAQTSTLERLRVSHSGIARHFFRSCWKVSDLCSFFAKWMWDPNLVATKIHMFLDMSVATKRPTRKPSKHLKTYHVVGCFGFLYLVVVSQVGELYEYRIIYCISPR